MSKVGEKVAYLKGLAEGLGVNDETEPRASSCWR